MIPEHEEHFPPAMLDMGMPEEMSPIEDITNAYNEIPMMEITEPLNIQDPQEIRKGESLTELREDRLDSIDSI